jgi:CRP/FNR family transcriptional activator FtrB
VQQFPAHLELAREGDRADFLHVVIDGLVEIFATHIERETTLGMARPQNTFIVASVVLDRIYLESTRVLEPAKILMIPATAVRQAMVEDAAFATTIATELVDACRNNVRELKNQKLRSSLERLAAWMLLRDRETGAAHRFTIPFEKKILAAHLGIAPEALSRSFATLSKYNVVINGAEVEIRDTDALERLARLNPLIDDPNA